MLDSLFDAITHGIRPIYNKTLRPHLPRKIGVMNGVAYRGPRLLDITDHHAEWKPPLVDAVRSIPDRGASVAFVGGGWCFAPVHAARTVGLNGHIDVYEATDEWTAVSRETVRLNAVDDRVDVHHAIVGEVVDARGPTAGADRIEPGEVPECDCLVLDAEGAERSILEDADELAARTDVLVVETHAAQAAPPRVVEELLDDWRVDSTPMKDEDALVVARPP